MNESNFCSLPFTEIFLGPDGIIKTCCSAEMGLGNIRDESIENILEGFNAQDIRQSIIDGKWHRACKQCQQLEKNGARSERKNNLEEFKKKYRDFDKKFFKLERLDLRWRNTCNLTCVYCYEYFSSKWAEIKGIDINVVNDEYENTLFLLIEKEKESIENVMLLGGEPLLQKQNQRLINLLNEKSFYLLTNLSIPLKNNPIAKSLLDEPTVTWGVSFENIEDRYEYVRRGADWKIFLGNIDYINENKKGSKLEAQSLYSVYSAFNLIEFYEFILEKKFDNVSWNLLESSGRNGYISVLDLSPELKKKAILEINKCQQRFPSAPGISDLIGYKNQLLINTTINYNNSTVLNDIKYVESLLKDNTRSFQDLWPDVFSELVK
jgi:MoaA/NifB/PqqE/SkfB family radical SAM enzyme